MDKVRIVIKADTKVVELLKEQGSVIEYAMSCEWEPVCCEESCRHGKYPQWMDDHGGIYPCCVGCPVRKRNIGNV